MNQGTPAEPSEPLRVRVGRRRLATGLAAAGILVAAIGLVRAGPTLATWSRSDYHNATLTSGVVNPPTGLLCNAASGTLTNPPLHWTASATGGNSLLPNNYTMVWSGAQGSGQSVVTGTSASVTGTGLGSYTLTVVVHATFGTWTSTDSTPSRSVTILTALGAIVSWTCS